jgi:hypothetical protein
MHPSVWLASIPLVITGFCNAGYSQTLIASFDDVAGEWAGHADTHSVSLKIDPRGRFTATYALGSESGEARLEAGTLVVPLPKHGARCSWRGTAKP